MKEFNGILILFLFFLLQASPARGQQFYFHKVLPPDGKSFEHVTCIVQDKQGFMWFATKRGLFSFDGFHMQYYKHNPIDINSLASDALNSIAADQQGMIWIGTAGMGLDRYDPSTRTFTHFRHSDGDPLSLSLDFVSAVLVDKEGVLWVGTGNGLNRYDAQTDRFIRYITIPGDSTSISANEIGTIYEDSKGIIWVGTGSVYGENASKTDVGGLNKFNKQTGTFTRYKSDPRDPKSLINNKVSAITEDSSGNFWIGTAEDGLHTMDRSTGLFERHLYDPAHPDKLSRPSINKLYASTDHITFIKEDRSGAIWIGTAESGINYYNTATQKVTHYESGENSTGSFTDRTAWAAYVSKEAVLWISSLTGSLYRVNTTPEKNPLSSIKQRSY